MVSILPDERTPWDVIGKMIGQNISQNFPTAIQQGYQQGVMNQQRIVEQQQQKARQDAIAQQFGPEIASLPPELQKLVIGKSLEAKSAPEKYKQQYNAKANAQLQLMKDLGLSDIFSAQQSSEDTNNPQQMSRQPQDIRQDSLIPESKIAAMSLVNPAVADKMQKHNDQILAERRHQQSEERANKQLALAERRQSESEKRAREASEFRERQVSPEAQRQKQVESAQAQNDVKYNQQLQEASKQHKLKKQTLDRLEELNKKGVTGKAFEKGLEKIGLVALTSEGRREFAAGVKNLITDIRSILGSQFTGFEFQTILNAYPSADFSKEANSAIMRNLKAFEDIRDKELEFAQELKKENGGRIPTDFQSKVNEKVQEYANSKVPEIKANTQKVMNDEYGIPDGNTLMFDPQGEPMSVPIDQVERLKSLGATLP